MRALRLLLVLCFSTLGCGDTGNGRITIELVGRGTTARPVALGSGSLTLTRADVAFGPAWLCASENARAELCEVALAELRETVVLRGMDAREQPLGALAGTHGEVRSGLYDLGLSWLLTETQARPSTQALAGHSAVLEGTLTEGGRSLRVSAALDVVPRGRGEAAVNGQRTRQLLDERTRLALEVDPHRWVDQLDAARLFALDADGDGAVTIEPGTPAYESILQGIVSRAPLAFAWSTRE